MLIPNVREHISAANFTIFKLPIHNLKMSNKYKSNSFSNKQDMCNIDN